LSKLAAKQFYLDQIEKDCSPHRRIANRMVGKFTISPALVKNELLKDGYIKIIKTAKLGDTQKLNYFFKLTGKKLPHTTEPKVLSSEHWDDGTPKSTGNAFDLAFSTRELFSKGEIARMTQKYHQNKSITIYSRA
jgi:hypothetical protein